MAVSLSIFCVVILLTARIIVVSASGECQSAVQAVTSASSSQTAATAVYQSLNESTKGVCGFTPTCCSSQAEQMLRQSVVTQYQTALHNNLITSFQHCVNNSLPDDTANFLEVWKNQLVDIITINFPTFDNPSLFNPFVNYFKNGVLSLSLPNFKEELSNMFAAVYHVSFQLRLDNLGKSVPNTQSFRDCLKNNFSDPETKDILDLTIRRLEPRINYLFRFLLAIKTSDSVLDTIKNHVLSPECGDALLRLTHCKECSGISSSSPPCTSFCQNVLRGCLVDLTEVGEVLQEFATAVQAMRNKLRSSTGDPFSTIDGRLPIDVLDVSTVARTAATQPSKVSEVESTCGVTFPPSGKRRRDVTSSHSVHRRNAPVTPNPSMDQVVSCASSVSQSILSLPDVLCTSVASVSGNDSCWNETSIGSYSKDVPAADRLSQVNNSELLVIRPNTGLMYRDAIAQLKNISTELSRCASDQPCPVRIVSLSIPSPSDFNLTGARYENITRPSPSYGNSVTSAITTFTPTPSTTFTPSTSVIEPLTSFSSSSVALIAKSSSNDNSITSVTLTSVTLTHLTTTPLPVTTQVMRPLSSSLLFHRMVSVTHLSPRPSSSSSPTPSNTMVAGATIGFSSLMSSLLLGIGGVGWLLLAISLLVNISLIIVLMKKKSKLYEIRSTPSASPQPEVNKPPSKENEYYDTMAYEDSVSHQSGKYLHAHTSV